MNQAELEKLFFILKESTAGMTPPMTELLQEDFGRKPFLVLTACLLSLRSQDPITYARCKLLFAQAQTPQELLLFSLAELEAFIYPINYYKKKAAQLHRVSTYLIEKHSGLVPKKKSELLAIPGVGLKTANLVLAEAFGIPELCVDTHVHRISNRLGLVKTKTPEDTEKEVKALLPPEYWRIYTRYCIMWGQNICRPLSPKCSICPINRAKLCQRVDVIKSR